MKNLSYFLRKNNLLLIVIVLVVFGFTSCKEKETLPENLIERESFKAILKDFQIAQGAIQQNKLSKDSLIFKNAQSYYELIFKSHKVTAKQFDETLTYYIKEPIKFDKLYGEIITELTKLEAELKKKKDE